MPNEQLLEYVRREVSRGITRTAISRTLVTVGWPVNDVNGVLVALQVPFDASDSPTAIEPSSPPRPANPETNIAATVTMGNVQIQTTPDSPVPQSEEQEMEGKLPGVFALFGNAIDLYRKNFKLLAGIGLIQFLLLLCAGLVFATVAIGTVLGSAALVGKSITVLVAGGTVFALLLVIFIWVTVFLSLALMHAVRGAASPEGISFREAFSRARPQVWSYLWIGILGGCVFMGSLLLYVALPLALLGAIAIAAIFYAHVLPIMTVITLLPVILVVAAALGVIGVLWVGFTVGTWLLFTIWVLVDGKAKGMEALLLSKQLAKKSFGALVARWTGIVLITIVIGIVIGIAANLISHLFAAGTSAAQIQAVISNLVIYPFLTPVILMTMYLLYRAQLQVSPVPAVFPPGKGWLYFLAILGFLSVLLIPTAGAVALAIFHAAQTR